jgi:rSAM/selenodomain-associated transferase 2
MAIHELAIIIPTFNEASTILRLLGALDRQQNIHLQVIIVDGGSKDNTLAVAEDFSNKSKLDYQFVSADRGRAKQLNQGANIATSEELLFLHADSELSNPYLLANALAHLKARRQAIDHIAGHFGLHFQREHTNHAQAYYFFESKARLNRLDTINGDQGFMLSKCFFEALGGFDESLDYMEDARLARKIFAVGQWVTLPGSLTTSARRFEIEGLKQRQILNALLCNFDHIGLTEFFTEAVSAYRAQNNTGTLELKPFFVMIHAITKRIGILRATTLWYKTGAYVASNAWQLVFALDCRRNYTTQLSPGEGPTPALRFYDRWLRFLIDSPPGHLIATVLTFIWFYCSLLVMVLRK